MNMFSDEEGEWFMPYVEEAAEEAGDVHLDNREELIELAHRVTFKYYFACRVQGRVPKEHWFVLYGRIVTVLHKEPPEEAEVIYYDSGHGLQ